MQSDFNSRHLSGSYETQTDVSWQRCASWFLNSDGRKKSSMISNSCCFCFSFQIIFHRSYNTCWDNKSQGLFPYCLRGCLTRESECECVCLTCWQGDRQALYIVFASTLERKVEWKGEEEVCVSVCDWEIWSYLRRLPHWADVIMRISS